MDINQIIVYIMVIFMILGGLDRIFGNKFGLGAQFEEGITAIGTLALSMVGIVTLSPVIARLLAPIVVPFLNWFGADPAMFAGSVLANDMGGASLAYDLAATEEAAQFGGLIVGSMLGPTIVFTIPVALGLIQNSDRKYLATGVLAGVITIPLGAFAGGLTAGFSIGMLIRNLIPIALFALLIALGLWRFERAMIKGFTLFGRFIVILITIGLVCGITEALTGIVFIEGLNPIAEGFETVANIAIVLAGAFPLVYTITKVLKKPLLRLGKLLRMNDVAAAGMIAALANSIPMFSMVKNMDNRGKVLNFAFATSAAFVFGDHLGFTAGFAPTMLLPMIVGKLTAGITAVILACFMTRKEKADGI